MRHELPRVHRLGQGHILEPHLAAQCRACKHRYYESEAHERGLRNCALCHTPLPLLGGDSPADLELHGYRQ